MQNILQFDTLIHPDFLQRERLYKDRHPIQEQLHKRWEERFGEIANDPTKALIYFSTYHPYEFAGRTIPKNRPLLEEELARIALLSDLLNHRFVRYNSNDFPVAQDLHELFEKQGLTYNPAETKLHAYGEIYEACVTGQGSWGKRLKSELQIPDEMYIPDEKLSLTLEQVRSIEAWHRSPEGIIESPLNKA